MKSVSLIVLACSTFLAFGAPLKVAHLRVESQINPQGISKKPRLSWKLLSDERGKFQSAYEILAANKAEQLDAQKADLWKSGKKKGAARHLVAWEGKELKDGQKVFWKVRIWEKGTETPGAWSPTAHFVVGGEKKLLKPTRSSSFASSSEQLNKLYAADVALLQKRLEGFAAGDQTALGTGAQVHRSARSLLYHFDCAAHLTHWLHSMDASVTTEGFFPLQPGSKKLASMSSDAGLIVTHPLWWMSGDASLARDRWAIYEGHMIARETQDARFLGTKWGEIEASEGVSGEFLDLCYMGFSCRLALELALPAMEPQKALRFQVYAARIRQSFRRQFVNQDGSLKTKSQTGHVLALRSNVLKKEEKNRVLADLLTSIRKEGSQVGPIGAHFLLGVLSITRNQDLAIKSLTKLDEKATNAYLGNGISEWLMASLGGVETIAPGFNQAVISPRIPKDDSIKWVKAAHDSPSGKISIHWEKLSEAGLKAEVKIPAGILSRITLPMNENQNITEGGKEISDSLGAQIVEKKNGKVVLVTQSGSYSFLIK